MNQGAFLLPGPQVGILNLGTRTLLGPGAKWRNIPANVRRLTLFLNRAQSSIATTSPVLRLGIGDTTFITNYDCSFSSFGAAAISSSQDTTAHIAGFFDATSTRCTSISTMVRDDFNNWILMSHAGRYGVNAGLQSLTSLAGDGAASLQLSPRGEMRTLELLVNGGAAYTAGTAHLIAELDAFPN